MSPLPLVDPIYGLPAADDQQRDVRLVLADLRRPPDRPAVAFGPLLQGFADVPIRGAPHQAAADHGVVEEGEPRCRRKVMHPSPSDRIAEHRNGEWPVGIPRPAGRTPPGGDGETAATAETPGGRPGSRNPGPAPTGTTINVTAAALATVAAANGNNGTRDGRQRRIGCSISHHDAPATASVTPHRAANNGSPDHPVTFAVERQEDWPVPQIDAVGDGAQPHQRGQRQDACDRPALFQCHRGDHENRRYATPISRPWRNSPALPFA